MSLIEFFTLNFFCAKSTNFCPLHLQGPVMPGSHSVERFVIEENLHCIIKTHWKERKTWWLTNSIMFQFCLNVENRL